MTVRRQGREGGFTLVEVTVVLAVVTFLVGAMVGLSQSTADSQKYSERSSRAIEINQALLNSVRHDLGSTVALFQGDAVGQAYWSSLEFDPQAPPITSSRLPVANGEAIFAREATSGARTGNVLMFARQAWTTQLTCLSARTHRIDVYRIVCFYLTAEDGGPQPGRSTGLNLCQLVTEPLADGEQIDRIEDLADRTEVLAHLLQATPDDSGSSYQPVELVWLRADDPTVSGTIRQITSGSHTLTDTPISPRSWPWRLRRDTERSSAGMLYYRHFSVATNHARPSWGIGRFGVRDDTGDGFPHGFEIQFAGPSSARQVLVHSTIVTNNEIGMHAHSDLRAIVFVHDV